MPKPYPIPILTVAGSSSSSPFFAEMTLTGTQRRSSRASRRAAAPLLRALLGLLLLGAARLEAGAAQPWCVPPEAAFCLCADAPAPTSRQAWAVLSSALRVALDSDVVDEGFRPAVQALLAAGQVGQGPYTLALLDLDLAATAEGKTQVADIRLVLELHTRHGHREALKALQSILAADAKAEQERQQEPIDLPGERRGVRYRVAGQPDWRTLEWASHEDGFTIALGAGTLWRWLALRDADAPNANVEAHRAAVRAARAAEGAAASERLLEYYIDIDRLRDLAPGLFRRGIVADTLNALKLGNSRSFMLHGSRASGMLLLDATYDTRREPPGQPRRKRLTLAAYPEDELRLPRPNGSFVLAAEVNWVEAYEWVMRVAEAVTDEPHRDDVRADRRRYELRHHERLYPLLAAFKPYLVLSDVPAPPLAIPGAATAYFELRDGVQARRLDARFARLFDNFRPAEEKEDWRDMHVAAVGEAWDERLWYLQVDELGLVRYPAWGWTERWLVASWSTQAVRENREMLSGDER